MRPVPTCQEALPLLWVQRSTCSRQQRAEDAAKVLVHLAPGGLQRLSLLLIQLSNDLQGAGRMTTWQCPPLDPFQLAGTQTSATPQAKAAMTCRVEHNKSASLSPAGLWQG